MEIAKRLGMPEGVVARARSFVSESHFRYEDALKAVEAKERELESARSALASEETALQLRSTELRRRETELDSTKRIWKKKYEDDFSLRERAALQKIDSLADEMRRELSDVAARHAFSQTSRRIVQAAKDELHSVRTAADAAIPSPAPESGAASALRLGGKVWIKPMKSVGVLESDPSARDRPASVLVGSMKMRLEWHQLRPMEDATPAAAAPGSSGRRAAVPVEASVPEELNLIGRTTGDAESELSVFLDRASRSGRASVRIVHGHGTGALKRAVREYLKRCGYDVSFRAGGAGEGGDGCTVVEFL